jgi:tellurite resistance protein TerC
MTWWWIGFNLAVVVMLAVDIGVLHRRAHVVHVREALLESAGWIALAFVLNGIILWQFGQKPALEFLTGYLIEKSLSVDNLFVFLLIFKFFGIPGRHQHRILFWGIIGALVMRAAFIFAGVALVQTFDWILYVFGAFLVISGIKLGAESDKEVHPDRNPLVRLVRRFFPVVDDVESGHFVTRDARGRRAVTVSFVTLIAVETTDVVFAVDSIPAILAITRDPFLVYSSNVMAILGLRALFFALAGLMRMFRYLHYGLSAVLVFIGVKMLVHHWVEIPTAVALGVLAALLGGSVVASVVWSRRHPEAAAAFRAKAEAAANGARDDTAG